MFPVLVTFPDGRQLTTCRVDSHTDGIDIWWWDDTQAVIVATGIELVAEGKRSWTMASDQGEVRIIMESGCGCSHPMKRWRPPARPKVAP